MSHTRNNANHTSLRLAKPFLSVALVLTSRRVYFYLWERCTKLLNTITSCQHIHTNLVSVLVELLKAGCEVCLASRNYILNTCAKWTHDNSLIIGFIWWLSCSTRKLHLLPWGSASFAGNKSIFFLNYFMSENYTLNQKISCSKSTTSSGTNSLLGGRQDFYLFQSLF